jgi:hypothetical protein
MKLNVCFFLKEKSCLLFLWSIIMIFMLLADGSVTVLSLREHQKQVELFDNSFLY